jgi:type I restriction-modification system DNA methylase subunit
MAEISEFTSYIYIKNELNILGWNTKNPNKNVEGQLYIQQEFLENAEITKCLGKLKPKYVVKVSEDTFYVIEANPHVEDIERSFSEAKEYAEKINNSEVIKVNFISGVAGNDEDGYVVRSAYYNGEKYEIINYHGKEITSLLSPLTIRDILIENSGKLKDLEINEIQLLKIAEEINEELHLASINKDERASVMATLLLSMIDDTRPNYNAKPTEFVKDINNRAEELLISHNKRSFFKHIVIKLPSKKEAQMKYKRALVVTIFKLMKINIRAAMNSGTDVLGKFYEVFLKYGNGAKDIGIVLTPRHITRFACEVLNITHKDLVYDPTCGTGGFLVSAFDVVRENSNSAQIAEFRKHRIFGVEQQPKVAALAVVNMIFRGDGSNNIVDNDCLSIGLEKLLLNDSKSAEYISNNEGKNPPITRVLMNPPFALKKENEKEYKFIQHALEQMEDGGLLFAIIPISVMIKAGKNKDWRKNVLLANNTLLSVITLPPQLFNPVSVHSCAIIVRKGEPHRSDQNVLWLRCIEDGYKVKKAKRIKDLTLRDDFGLIKDELKLFILDQTANIENVPEFKKVAPINFDDALLELVPEAYLDIKTPDQNEIKQGMEELIRETASFILKAKLEEDFID